MQLIRHNWTMRATSNNTRKGSGKVLRRDVKKNKMIKNIEPIEKCAIPTRPHVPSLSFRFFLVCISNFLESFCLSFLVFCGVCEACVCVWCVTTILHQRTLQSHFLFNKKQDDKEIPVDLHVCERVLQKKTREREKFRFFFLLRGGFLFIFSVCLCELCSIFFSIFLHVTQ
jgi:hypothetical protein